MKKHLNFFFLLMLSLFSIGSKAVTKQTLDTESTLTPDQAGLKHAMLDLVVRSKAVTHTDQLSYLEQLSDNKGNSLTRYYNANLPLGDRWQQLELMGEDINQSELQIDIPILMSPSFINLQQFSFHHEDEHYWVFTIETTLNAENESGHSEELNKAASTLQTNLNTYIYVDKHSQQFTRLEIANTKPFRPSTLAKIELFSVVVDYAAAWESGPWVAVSSVRKLKGNYGFLIEIDKQVNQQLSQFSFVP